MKQMIIALVLGLLCCCAEAMEPLQYIVVESDLALWHKASESNKIVTAVGTYISTNALHLKKYGKKNDGHIPADWIYEKLSTWINSAGDESGVYFQSTLQAANRPTLTPEEIAFLTSAAGNKRRVFVGPKMECYAKLEEWGLYLKGQ